jgi:uncharacterized protein YoxC
MVTLGLSSYLYTQMVNLQAQVAVLSTRVSGMTQQINVLNAQLNEKESQIQRYLTFINDLQSQVSNYREQNAQLESQISQLKADYQRLQSEQDILKGQYNYLQGQYNYLQSSYNSLNAENNQLRNLLDLYEKVPHSYYSSGNFFHHGNTYNELCSFLMWEFTLPRGYELGVFDCSEASSYLEWALENAGFNAYIAVGPTPWSQGSGYHAWVIAFTTDNYRVPIEATALTGGFNLLSLFMLRTPGIVYSQDPLIPGWQNYYGGYDRLFKNIYEAVRAYGSVQEWNWWDAYWGMP